MRLEGKVAMVTGFAMSSLMGVAFLSRLRVEPWLAPSDVAHVLVIVALHVIVLGSGVVRARQAS